jgi:hypothetical protein
MIKSKNRRAYENSKIDRSFGGTVPSQKGNQLNKKTHKIFELRFTWTRNNAP